MILPDPRLEMPALRYPGRKPVGRVALDWDNKYTDSLVTAIVPTSNYVEDIALFKTATGSTAPYLENALYYSSTANDVVDTVSMRSRVPLLFLFVGSCGDISLWDAGGIVVQALDFPVTVNVLTINRSSSTPTALQFYFGSGTPIQLGLAISLLYGKHSTFALRVTNTGDISQWSAIGYANGEKIGTTGMVSGQSATKVSSENININSSTVGERANFQMEAMYIWQKEFTDAEVFEIMNDPYQFIVPT